MKFILPGAIIILIIGAFFYPVTKQASITIHTSMFNVYNQLNNAASWKRWDTDFKGTTAVDEQQIKDKKGFTVTTPKETIQVRFLDAFIFGVKKGNDNYSFVLIPEKYDRTTTVIVSFKSNLLYELLPGQSDKWLKKTSVNDLKNYLENPLSYYGINFKKVTIKDMDMMVYKTVVNPADRFTEVAKSIDKIHSLLPATALADSDKIYLQTTPLNNRLMMFIGVHIKKQLPSTRELEFMQLPAGKALIVNYKGKYKERQKVYTDIQNYLQDHEMKSTFQPIEVYSRDSLPINDTSSVNTQIIFSAY